MPEIDHAAQPSIFGPKAVFPTPPLDPAMMLVGLVADMATIRQTSDDTNRRVGEIKQGMAEFASGMRQNAETLTQHKMQIEALEEDIIPNGKLRIKVLEDRAAWFVRAFLAGGGTFVVWFLTTYVVPLLAKH